MILASLSVTVHSLGSLLGLGGIFFILLYVYAASDAADVLTFKNDPLLQERMQILGIPSWKALQQKSGLTSLRLRLVRRGEIRQLTLDELKRLAIALDWTLADLMQSLGISSRTEVREIGKASEIEELQQECARLRDRLQQQSTEITADMRYLTFQQLQSLLTNYPSARQMVQAKPDLPAKNLTSLFTPLENLLESWGYSVIGSAWEQLPYNPQLHQADADDIAEGELVYVRFVGYRNGDRLLCPAKVSRTLPAATKK